MPETETHVNGMVQEWERRGKDLVSYKSSAPSQMYSHPMAPALLVAISDLFGNVNFQYFDVVNSQQEGR